MSTSPTSPSSPSPSDSTESRSVTVEGLVYRLDRAPTKHGKRSVVSVALADVDERSGAPPLVDRLDLYAFRSRRAFAGLVADVFGRDAGAILGHLALVLDTLEREAEQRALTGPRPEELSPERRAVAEALLEAPDVLGRAAEAMTALGYVGEAETKQLAFLIATSRLLRRPLSAILMAPSGCGKSELLEVLARLLPAESVEFLSRLTPQALFYAGPEALRHKLVLVDEAVGASESDYAIRTLQSKGLLTLRRPGKADGREQTCTVHGPISLMSGTTSQEWNPENLSRCLELALDDSPAQTERIQAAQREAWARAPRTGDRRAFDPAPWQDAQRVLEALPIVIPYARELRFPARTTADRRGNQKLLGLIAAHTLLHQRQRERDGEAVVATLADYRAVHTLLRPGVERDLAGLSPRAARVFRALLEAEAPLSRRELATRNGWVYNTSKKALAELVAQELVAPVDPGPPARYRVLDRSILGDVRGLVDPDAISPPTVACRPRPRRRG